MLRIGATNPQNSADARAKWPFSAGFLCGGSMSPRVFARRSRTSGALTRTGPDDRPAPIATPLRRRARSRQLPEVASTKAAIHPYAAESYAPSVDGHRRAPAPRSQSRTAHAPVRRWRHCASTRTSSAPARSAGRCRAPTLRSAHRECCQAVPHASAAWSADTPGSNRRASSSAYENG